MPRVIWKGAVSFGLVNIPVSLMPATVTRGIDFDWLDKRSMEPVGYKRINKATGEDITSENIVRAVKFEKNRYVVLSDEEIRAAYPESTQTVDIIAFVRAEQIPLRYIDPLKPASADGVAEIISLADLLKRSLGKKPGEAKAAAKPAESKKSVATTSRRPKRGKAGG